MWNTLPFEQKIEARLKKDYASARGAEIFAEYARSRRIIVEEIAPEIKAKMPEYSDHGPPHLANVLNNVETLLGEEFKALNGAELYVLGLIVLFHDVGNIHGREEHNKNIAEIYDYVRGASSNKREKHIVLVAAGAHSGTARDGSKDALRDVTETDHLFERPVRLRQLAAIVRFADELAEGPQRTSEYMRTTHRYADASKIYHTYASITHVAIDRGFGRIVLKYDPHITSEGTIPQKVSDLRNLLEFTYQRIVKLDQERRYAKFYSEFLAPFSRTEVTFTFWVDEEFYDLGLSPIQITDKIVPGDATKTIPQLDTSYGIDHIIGQLEKHLPRGATP